MGWHCLPIAICVRRPEPAFTRIGLMLRRAHPSNRPTAYYAARAKFAHHFAGSHAGEALIAEV